jgi:hypothetical protein
MPEDPEGSKPLSFGPYDSRWFGSWVRESELYLGTPSLALLGEICDISGRTLDYRQKPGFP